MSNDDYSTNPIYNRTGILILCSKQLKTKL